MTDYNLLPKDDARTARIDFVKGERNHANPTHKHNRSCDQTMGKQKLQLKVELMRNLPQLSAAEFMNGLLVA